jgi:ribosomal protein L11 methylase PrmA
MIPSIHGEKYDDHWRGMSIKGNRILDLGCDLGSTADYFLRNGAVSVVGVDANQEYIESAWSSNLSNFLPIHMTITNSRQVEALINTIMPDIVKVDIEGAEVVLLNLSREVLRKPLEWDIETHTSELFRRIEEKYVSAGFEVQKTEYFRGGGCAVIIARRK